MKIPAFASLMLFLCSCVAGFGAAAAKPNVIFILADDLGYGDLGAFGQKILQTPNIDKIAAEGMRFTQAYAGATVCAPSRCTLMTGLHNGHAPIRGNRELEGEGQLPMPADTFTVAKLMKQAGYTTGIVGKWGLGFPGSHSTPPKMGFDYFYGYNCQRQAHEYYPPHLWRNEEKVMLDGKFYSHDLMAEEALGFVKKNASKPFYLYLAFTIPHTKIQVPDIAPYENANLPENLKKLAAMYTRLDRDVGRIMALLKELKIDDNTMVFFASDNGAAHRNPEFAHSGPLRGFKRDMYEGGLRSPSIVRWPGKIKAGVVSDQVWGFVDFLPTMAELSGAKPPAGLKLDGISVLQAFTQGKKIEHPPIYFEFHERGFTQAARMGDWKAVRMGTKLPVELYDMKTDFKEANNVAAAHPEVVKKFEQYLNTERTETELWPIVENAQKKGSGGAGKKKSTGDE
ncbi:MAG: arylsulfatase [Verrucomicrobiota bacterium]